MNEKENLKIIILDIKNKGSGYDKLMQHQYVLNILKSAANFYSKIYNFEYDDVYQNSILVLYELTEKFSVYDNKKSNVGGSYISYLKKYLPKRLHNYYDSYSIFRNRKGIEVSSLDVMVNDDNSEINPFGESYFDCLDLEGMFDKLSPREIQVIELFRMGYLQTDIANILGISDEAVRQYKKNILKKVLK